MPEKQLTEIVKGFMSGGTSRTDFATNLHMPFLKDISAAFHEAGLSEAIDNPKPIPNLSGRHPGTSPMGDLTAAPFFMGIAIFMGTTLGSWAVSKLTDELYDAKIRPALLTLANRYDEHYESKGYEYELEIEFLVYFETDELEIVVRAEADSAEAIRTAAALIPEAEKAALAWVQDHGVTSNRLTYRIKNGELSNFPKLD